MAIKSDGKVIQRVSGRFSLISLLKMGDGSSLIAEVHQAAANEPALLVHPNVPEAEALITNLAKNPAAFLHHYLDGFGVDKAFVRDLVKTFVDPALIHEAANCKWVEETKTVVTPEEQEEEEDEKLGQQSWFVDIVAQYEDLQKKEKGGKSKNFASAAMLYDLDAEKSIKTMHEKNDGVDNAEEMVDDGKGDDVSSLGADGSVEVVGVKKGGLQKNAGEKVSSTSEQSGDTPKSGSVRFQTEGDDSAAEFGDS